GAGGIGGHETPSSNNQRPGNSEEPRPRENPSSNIQAPEKIQAPRSKSAPTWLVWSLDVGAWMLDVPVGASLAVGAWILELPQSRYLQLTIHGQNSESNRPDHLFRHQELDLHPEELRLSGDN